MIKFPELIANASPVLRHKWNKIDGNPRVLFDQFTTAWCTQTIDMKIELLKRLESEDLLDPLLAEYFELICIPLSHIAAGLLAARTEYHNAGYELRMPAEMFLGIPRYRTFEVAAIARTLEDDRTAPCDMDSFAIELRRLHLAIDEWLTAHGQAIEAAA
jgi:hypothetical protein